MPAEALTASLEDYLEAIHVIVSEKRVARVRDIAGRLDVHKSTVTAALHTLADRQLINYVPYEAVTLTPRGRRAGANVLRRHETLRRFLTDVFGVGKKTATETACKMEHVIPSDVVERFAAFSEFIEVCPRAGAEWIRGFGYFREEGRKRGNCERCVELTLKEAGKHRHACAGWKEGDAV